MSTKEAIDRFQSILARFAAKELSEQEARERLLELEPNEDLVDECLHIANGGSDVIVEDTP